MKKLAVLLIASMFLVSCAHGITNHFPKAINANDSAAIYIIRNKNFFGSGGSAKLMLDGRAIAHINVGEYIHFQLHPDVHSVGTPESTISIPFKKGEKYYFLISLLGIGGQGFEIERIDPEEATTWLKSSVELTKWL
jgi:hypothetical protein